MPFTVDTFRSRLEFGGARQNLFEVLIPFPAAANSTVPSDQISFMCKAASLPPENLGLIQVPYFGRFIKIPGDRTFPEWTVRIINDEDFGIRDTFEQWSNALNGHYSNLRDPTALLMSGYAGNATVMQYGKTGDVIKEVSLIGVWPQVVTPIELAWDANDQIEEFQVTLQYQWTESNTSS
jgi:hypothetical protein